MSTRRRTWLRRAATAVAAVAGALGVASPALGAGITLDRSPSPPQAIKLGTPQQLNFQISFTSVPNRYELNVLAPGGATFPVTSQFLIGAASPVTGATTWTPPVGLPEGRYTAQLQFFSNVALNIPETTATAIFDVAAELGGMTLLKYEDMNGNGQRDAGEPVIPGWRFNLVNPQGNPASVTTGADGSVTLTNIPAGQWTVTEELQPGWAAVNPPNGTKVVTVPPNGTVSEQFGNARPAPLSGIVWVDTDKDQVKDASEAVRPGVVVELSGADGLGRAVASRQAITDANGFYEFAGLVPGTYSVKVTVPVGFTNTTPTTRASIPVRSATASRDNDFGIVPGSANTAGNPTAVNLPNGSVTKVGPLSARRGQIVTYTITARNTTSNTLRNVVLRDPVPRNMTVVAVPTGATLENGVVTWQLGTMRPGASRTVSLRVRINSAAPLGNHTNVVTLTATGVTPRQARTTLRVIGPRRIPRTGAVTG